MVTFKASLSSFCSRCFTPLLTKYSRFGRPASKDLNQMFLGSDERKEKKNFRVSALVKEASYGGSPCVYK